MSYPIAAFVVGYLAERGFDRRYVTSFLAMLAGLVVIYASGAIWLGLFVRTAGRAPIGVPTALALGVYPFVVADLMKLLVAASILPGLWRLFGRTVPRACMRTALTIAGSDSSGGRRHPGRPQDVRRSRRVRHERHHRRHRAEHARRHRRRGTVRRSRHRADSKR